MTMEKRNWLNGMGIERALAARRRAADKPCRNSKKDERKCKLKKNASSMMTSNFMQSG
jgi:hypothetical protein